MKLIKNIFLYLCISSVSVILFVGVLEILTRGAVGIYSGDANSFRYGFNTDIKLERHGKRLAFKHREGPIVTETHEKNLSQKPFSVS